MSTLDEITNEKQRITEALARVDAQREKLTGQLEELEATERVLARYSKGTQTKKTASAKTPTTATKSAAPARPGGRSRTATAKPAGGKRSSPSLSDQVLALAIGKTQQEITAHARALARTMSAPRLPGTSGLAVSKSAMGSSTPRSRRDAPPRPRACGKKFVTTVRAIGARSPLARALAAFGESGDRSGKSPTRAGLIAAA